MSEAEYAATPTVLQWTNRPDGVNDTYRSHVDVLPPKGKEVLVYCQYLGRHQYRVAISRCGSGNPVFMYPSNDKPRCDLGQEQAWMPLRPPATK